MSSYQTVLFFTLIILVSWFVSALQTSLLISDYSRGTDRYLNLATVENIRNSQFNESLAHLLKTSNINSPDLEKLCKSHLENSADVQAIHNDYLCLAKIEFNRNKLSNGIYFLSKAQDLTYSQATEIILNKALADQEVLTSEQLNEIAKDPLHKKSGLANYRLSIIKQLGRTDSRFTRHIDIQKAFEYRKKATKLLNITPQDDVNIAMTFDSKYHKYALTSMLSMLLSSNIDSKYSFYIIHNGESLTEKEMSQIKNLQKLADFNLTFTKVPEMEGSLKHVCNIRQSRIDRFSKYTLWRIKLHDTLPPIDKVIYIDPDTIILSDLTLLYRQDLQNNLIGAVPEQGIYHLNNKLDRSNSTYPYFNAGLLLLDLKNIRKSKIIENQLSKKSNFDCTYPDQDILNHTFQKDTFYLGYNWNRVARKSQQYQPNILPNIIHFSGINKPDMENAALFITPEFLEFYNGYKSFVDQTQN